MLENLRLLSLFLLLAQMPVCYGMPHMQSEQRVIIRDASRPTNNIVYDADSNRVNKTIVGSTTTYYLVDELNPTGYAQVIEERSTPGGNPVVSYVYGLDLISQKAGSTTRYYHYDAQGSTRLLTNGSGTTTDTFTYDAFGIDIDSTVNTSPVHYRYTGEQWDEDLGMYYLRARFYDPQIGRFITMDSFEGNQNDPLSLHKYAYTHNNPVNMVDPSGNFTLVSMMAGLGLQDILQTVKAGANTAVQFELRGLKKDILNDLSFKDRPGNHRTGIAGEKVWVRYLNQIGFKAKRSVSLSANGPDIIAAGKRNGRYHVIIGEVKASASRVPGVSTLKWNIMNGYRQMSYAWLDKYGSQILEGLIDLGLEGIGQGHVDQMLDRGQLEVYLLGAHKKSSTRWKIRGFRLIHAGGDEVLGGLGGIPEIVNEREVLAR